MIEIKRFNYQEKAFATMSYTLRREVFVNEQGVPPELEYDGADAEACHYLLLFNNEAIATARWRETEGGVKLERFAMKINFRGKGYGYHILKAVMDDVLKLKKPVYLHAQDKAVNFYKKNGFEIVGEAFEEAGIVHYKMVWKSRNI